MMRVRSWGVCALALTSAVACGHDFEPPDRAVRVERARERYAVARFDTIAWDDADTRLLLGNTVYAERCRRCHGSLGRGETDYARERGLIVPSLVDPAWRYGQLDSLRLRLFVGHESGMPVFGDGTLSPREIDATATYIMETLRPDAIGGA